MILEVDNPWPVGLTVRRSEYVVRLAGSDLLAGEVRGPVDVVARDTTELRLPIVVRWADLRGAAGATGDDVPWEVDVALTIDTPLGERTVPVELGGTLPVLHVPTVAVDDLRLGRTELGYGIGVDLRLDAPGGLRWTVEEAHFGLLVDERPLVSGLARTVGDDLGARLTFEAAVDPAAGWEGVKRAWAGEEVVGAVVLEATLRTPLGPVPLATRLEQRLAAP